MADIGQTATVFGRTGFLGSRICTRLAEDVWTVRAAVRHPDRAAPDRGIVPVYADVHDGESVARAVDGAKAVVNAVSLYVETGAGGPTFRSVHVEGAARVARMARAAGAERLIHGSGIGADPAASSGFIRARGEGETEVRNAFPQATVLRPSVMFGPGDSFFTSLAGIVRCSPVVPVIGAETRLQPVYVDDVARLVAVLLRDDVRRGAVLELGGGQTATMREIVEWLCGVLGRRRVLLPVPFPVARLQARLAQLLPSPPLTVDQVELLRNDNVVRGESGFAGTDISPAGFSEIVPAAFEFLARSETEKG